MTWLNAPGEKEIISKIKDFLKGSILVSHNAEFDISDFSMKPFFVTALKKINNPVIDTWLFHATLFPEAAIIT